MLAHQMPCVSSTCTYVCTYVRTSGFTIILWYLPPAGWEREYCGRSILKQERVGAILDTWLGTANDDDDVVETQVDW